MIAEGPRDEPETSHPGADPGSVRRLRTPGTSEDLDGEGHRPTAVEIDMHLYRARWRYTTPATANRLSVLAMAGTFEPGDPAGGVE